MNGDLVAMSREELIAEVQKLRHGIRQHRDSSLHDLCWFHPDLWGLLPEKTDPVPVVPEWPQFIQGCVRYRQSLDEQAPRAPRSREPFEDHADKSTAGPVTLRRFESPDEVREMPNGRFEIVRFGDFSIGRATYQPGWKWSADVGPAVGADRCTVEHLGLVLAGTATAAFPDGIVIELTAGSLFQIPARPHDSWVVGNEPYVSLHFLGADRYAK